MKKLSVIIIGIISLVAFSVGCQDVKQNQKETAELKQQFGKMNQRFKSELNLSESQEKKWDDIHLEYREKFIELRQDTATDRKDRIEKGKVIADEMDEEMLVILDEDQKEIYTRIAAENRNKAKEKYKHRKNKKSGKQSFMQMKNELNLTENQTEQWDAIQEDYKPKFKEIRESGQPGSDKTKEEMLTMFEQKNKEIVAILDSNQKRVYSAFVNERKQMAKQRSN